MNRRSFFSGIAKAAAIALACPMILREVVKVETPSTIGIYEMLKQCSVPTEVKKCQLDLDELFKTLYRIKREREIINQGCEIWLR